MLIALALASLRVALAVVPVSHARITFPFDIDWIEGGQLAHAARILEGRPIYGAPDFLPHPYPPLHYLVLAGIGAVTRLDFPVARGLSVASFLIGLAFIVRALHRGTTTNAPSDRLTSLALGAAAVGLTLRTYSYAEGWLDLARSDTLLFGLVAIAGAVASDPRRAVPAGLLLGAAIYTKQTAVFFAVALAIDVARRSPRHAARMALACLIPCTVAFVWLEVASRGAFHTWLMSTRGHGFDLRRLAAGAWLVARACPLLAIVPLLAWVARRNVSATSSAMFALWVGALPACLLPYAKNFGMENNLVPLLGLSAVLPLFFVVDVARDARRVPVTLASLAAAAVVLATWNADVARLAPPREVALAMDRNLAEVRALPGTIACPVHPFLGPQLGKGPATSSWHSLLDAGAAGRPVDRTDYIEELLAKRADWIILTNMSIEHDGDLEGGIRRDYDWHHNFSTPSTGEPATFHSMPRMAFRRRAPQ